ncbi:hypothetical protein [Clostridium algidicarnis]|uniref:Uncharacterized protein n=1 Tax=Clostridium algidicarnis DSM 15099 TaxID=1121295 RepID=A0A2S6FVD0_9CLOT|nr:hypothetical protein [Clostridium algidicarnis]PPK45262.1 hypothetical protein BD821_12010 [Clostridium algidicarnis DSM 15099]
MLRDLRYYACVGIIDFFELTMDRTEVAIKLTDNSKHSFDNEVNVIGSSYSVDIMSRLEKVEERVREIIFENEKEYPNTIRYFPIPNLDYCDFDVCVVAKISNNGSTYIFSPNERYLQYMSGGQCHKAKLQ